MIEQTEKNNSQDMYRSLQARHTTLDAYLAEIGEDAKQFHEEMHDQAEQNTKEALALDALARHLKLGASEDEILDEFKKTGTADPEALMENWRQAGRLSEIREGILRMKASRHAIDTAVIHEPGTLEKEQEKETAKAAKSKSKAKAADKTADKADDWSDAKKPAAKKTTAKKPAAKKAADKDAKADKAPAKKKTA
ncbi:MAG: trigger factor, partial [Coriobacteriales bacterium]|nr:trigger factor [Coriobacteriales bacterium]